ncbi:hypothetical protein LCGC14_2127410 [marine sediment metagenome]|uniref:Uncharacterized protein n=1 Tax=marine sediment metagenome TaxID=412755 RepID=A0A0F9E2F5_9ZZZZ
MKIEEITVSCDICGVQIIPMVTPERCNLAHITIKHNNLDYTIEKDLCEVCYKPLSHYIFKIKAGIAE